MAPGGCRASKAARDRVGEWHLHGLHVIPGETPRPFCDEIWEGMASLAGCLSDHVAMNGFSI